ncbi:MAG: LEA type 2 family protein [Chloroflexi bacterium]|nr:LEA type 2 family protein [Chloroflexota bacterium]
MIGKLLLALLALFLVMVFLAVLAVAFGVAKPPKLVAAKHSWGQVNRESTQVVTLVQMENPNVFDINTSRISFQADIYLNDVLMGRGSLAEVHIPSGASTSRVETHMDNNLLPRWWASHLENQEFTTVRIQARGILHLVRNFSFSPPDLSRTVETDLLGKANSTDPQVLSQGPFSLLIKSRQLQWGQVKEDTTEVLGSLVVRNTGATTITVARTSVLARMNAVVMAQTDSTEAIPLPPGKDVTVPFRAVMDNSRLLEWWPSHVNAAERTTFSLRVEATLVGTGADGTPFSLSVPLLEHQDLLVTNLLGR